MSAQEDTSTIVASLSTVSAHAIKLCLDLIANNTKTCILDFFSDHVQTVFVDSKNTVFVIITIPAINLTSYVHNNNNRPVSVSVPARTFYKALRSMRKKDSLEMILYPSVLKVRVFPAQQDRMVESMIRVQPVKTVIHNLPTTQYTREVEIVSNDFTKVLKDLCINNQTLNIRVFDNLECVEFAAETKRVLFGSDVGKVKENNYKYSNEFDSSSILSILKITSISRTIQVSVKEDEPLKLTTHIGTLGCVEAYIKSIELKV